jgi:hypothetical protein
LHVRKARADPDREIRGASPPPLCGARWLPRISARRGLGALAARAGDGRPELLGPDHSPQRFPVARGRPRAGRRCRDRDRKKWSRRAEYDAAGRRRVRAPPPPHRGYPSSARLDACSEIHAGRMTATTRRRITTLARRTGIQPARRVSAAPGLVVTAPDCAPISDQAPSGRRVVVCSLGGRRSVLG